MAQFVNNSNRTIDFNNINKLISLNRRINSRGTISKILDGTTLVYELFCKGVNGKYRRENGVISVSLEINDKIQKYVISIISKGNHPNDFKRMICDYCLSNGWHKNEDNIYFSKNILADDRKNSIFHDIITKSNENLSRKRYKITINKVESQEGILLNRYIITEKTSSCYTAFILRKSYFVEHDIF